ncbi:MULTISPECIES: cell division topological specificity factor MinE [Lysobacter]|jgi:cell division topological specificity factor|uniref:Cell division topological specificity factor n=2 Tax=Lysobacter TaxID=68 RepID=A0A3D8VB61_9GAMM|nr:MULTISPECIES: cell division topological specificity factor MinE [Lysobacter]MDG2519647.1 cell division topological specificity factor MinE [Lysobacter soli]QGW65795.1 cell division topological specificity factor MinE [Lysobacter soli]RDY66543.1 cell division topological specificity factor MinE [Lysobacter soli]UTA55823.1 cell division topological specificity factor MinE [Lysobacter soli]BDU17359.1 cell division topological specificity factor MinE [Lysobacter auxotrophicus]
MGLFDFLLAKKQTATIAKDRLRIIVAHERAGRGSNSPDYLPMLQRELLEVIRKYINVDAESVKVDLIGEGDSKVLDISVALPENPAQA